MRVPERGRVLATSLMVSVLAAACGSSAQDGAATTGGGPPVGDAPSAEFRDRNLVVTAACAPGADGGWTVFVDGWDPESWTRESKAEFPVPAGVLATEQQAETAPRVRSGLAALCTPDPRGPLSRSTRDGEGGAASVRLARSLFDRDFTRMAVVIPDRNSGASHVGYVDRDGSLTDLTAAQTGFGATPTEQWAVLSPDGADVWFTYRADGGWQVGSRPTHGDHQLTRRSATEVPDLPLFLVGNPVRGLVAYNVVVSPDGRRYSGWVPADNNDDDVFAVPSVTAALTGATSKVADGGCAGAVGWLDDDTLLCPIGVDDNLAAVAVDGTAGAERQPILPDNDRDNIGMVISPDGGHVVFVSVAGTERAYWITATRPGATPKKVEIAGLSGSAVFVEWR